MRTGEQSLLISCCAARSQILMLGHRNAGTCLRFAFPLPAGRRNIGMVFLKGYHPFAAQGGATLFDDVRVVDLGP
jgi:hypothetical protein